MTLKTPSGMPASVQISASFKAVSGVSSDGLRTTEQPQASAGAIPGDDRAGHADRLAERVVEKCTVNRNRLAIDAPDPARIVAEAIDGGVHVAAQRLAIGLPIFKRFESSQFFLVPLQQFSNAQQYAFLFRWIFTAPGARFKALAGRTYRLVYVLARGIGHGCQQIAESRAAYFDSGVTVSLAESPINEVASGRKVANRFCGCHS
jgi:hypothetical protein